MIAKDSWQKIERFNISIEGHTRDREHKRNMVTAPQKVLVAASIALQIMHERKRMHQLEERAVWHVSCLCEMPCPLSCKFYAGPEQAAKPANTGAGNSALKASAPGELTMKDNVQASATSSYGLTTTCMSSFCW